MFHKKQSVLQPGHTLTNKIGIVKLRIEKPCGTNAKQTIIFNDLPTKTGCFCDLKLFFCTLLNVKCL